METEMETDESGPVGRLAIGGSKRVEIGDEVEEHEGLRATGRERERVRERERET